MNDIKYNIKIGNCLSIDIEIPALESLKKFTVWNKQTSINRNKTIQRLNPSIPSEGGIYFLFYSDNRLLYIGKSANIRQRLNGHTSTRTIQEIAEQKRGNPKHIFFASWLLEGDEGSREIIETAYLQTYGTAWNLDKIDKHLNYPQAPEDEDLNLPKVQAYLKKEQQLIDDAIVEIGKN